MKPEHWLAIVPQDALPREIRELKQHLDVVDGFTKFQTVMAVRFPSKAEITALDRLTWGPFAMVSDKNHTALTAVAPGTPT